MSDQIKKSLHIILIQQPERLKESSKILVFLFLFNFICSIVNSQDCISYLESNFEKNHIYRPSNGRTNSLYFISIHFFSRHTDSVCIYVNNKIIVSKLITCDTLKNSSSFCSSVYLEVKDKIEQIRIDFHTIKKHFVVHVNKNKFGTLNVYTIRENELILGFSNRKKLLLE